MNRGFKAYFRDGKRNAVETLAKKGNKLRVFLFLLIDFFGRIIMFPFFGMFNLMRVKVARSVRNNQSIALDEVLSGCDDSKAYWTSFKTAWLKAVLFVSGLIILFVLTGVLFALGYYIGALAMIGIESTAALVLALPGLLAIVLYAIIFGLKLAPTDYVIDTLDGTVSESVKKSMEAMNNGKWTLLCLRIVKALRIVLVTAFYGILTYLLITFNSDTVNAINQLIIPILHAKLAVSPLIIMIVNVLGVLFGIFGLKRITDVIAVSYLTTAGAEFTLYEDLVLDKYNESAVISGVSVKHFKQKHIQVSSIESNLARLFDETEEVDYLTAENAPKVADVIEDKADADTYEQLSANAEQVAEQVSAEVQLEQTDAEQTESDVADKQEESVDPIKTARQLKAERKQQLKEQKLQQKLEKKQNKHKQIAKNVQELFDNTEEQQPDDTLSETDISTEQTDQIAEVTQSETTPPQNTDQTETVVEAENTAESVENEQPQQEKLSKAEQKKLDKENKLLEAQRIKTEKAEQKKAEQQRKKDEAELKAKQKAEQKQNKAKQQADTTAESDTIATVIDKQPSVEQPTEPSVTEQPTVEQVKQSQPDKAPQQQDGSKSTDAETQKQHEIEETKRKIEELRKQIEQKRLAKQQADKKDGE